METCLASWKLAKGLSITPFLPAYTTCFQRTCPRSALHRFECQLGALGLSYRYGGTLYPQALPLGERFGWPRHNRTALASHTHQDRGFPNLWISLSGQKADRRKNGMKANRIIAGFQNLRSLKRCYHDRTFWRRRSPMRIDTFRMLEV